MRKVAWGVVLACSMLVTSGRGQQKPDLTGSWMATTEAPGGVVAAPSAVFGARLWLKQDGNTLTVTRPVRDASVTATYPLDGSEVRTRIPGALCVGDAESFETAAWDGTGIVFTVVGSIPPGGTRSTLSVRRVLRLQSPDALVIEATIRDAAQGTSRQVGTVYKRTSDPAPAAPDPGPKVQKALATVAQVAWISGVWSGTAGTATIEERWTPAAGGAILATARTLRGPVMSSFEFLCIAERDGSLVYSAMPNGRSPATHFVLTAVGADSATFENPGHDFPKLIRYARRADGSMETTISGDGKSKPQTFVLARQPYP
jgi:hypothetical protein